MGTAALIFSDGQPSLHPQHSLAPIPSPIEPHSSVDKAGKYLFHFSIDPDAQPRLPLPEPVLRSLTATKRNWLAKLADFVRVLNDELDHLRSQDQDSVPKTSDQVIGVLQMLDRKLSLIQHARKGSVPLRDFPTGYKYMYFAFEPKSEVEVRRLSGTLHDEHDDFVTGRMNKEIVFHGIIYRIDPYIYGHPSFKAFRSPNEFRPHLAWLLHGQHLCRGAVPTPSEWHLRDFALCGCLRCPAFVVKFISQFYLPLTRPSTLSAAGNRVFDSASPSAVFRVGEHVWVRVIVRSNGKLKAAPEVHSSLISDSVRSTLEMMSNRTGSSTKDMTTTLWPAFVTKRELVDDEILDAIIKDDYANRLQNSRRQRIAYGDFAEPTPAPSSHNQQARRVAVDDDDYLEPPPPRRPYVVNYTLSLLGVDEQRLEGVKAGSILPYLARKPASTFLECPRVKHEDVKLQVVESFRAARQAILNSSHSWRKVDSSCIVFGNEVIRTGDLIRLKPPVGSSVETVVRLRSFEFENDDDGEEFSITGWRWDRDERFCVTLRDYHTRCVAWLPKDDVRHQLRTFRMSQIAGRLYPVTHDGLLASGYNAAVYWYDWRETLDSGAFMPGHVTRGTGPPSQEGTIDDRDIVNARRRIVRSELLAIAGPSAAAPRLIEHRPHASASSTRKRKRKQGSHGGSVDVFAVVPYKSDRKAAEIARRRMSITEVGVDAMDVACEELPSTQGPQIIELDDNHEVVWVGEGNKDSVLDERGAEICGGQLECICENDDLLLAALKTADPKGEIVQCDRCFQWEHIYCNRVDPATISGDAEYLCVKCEPDRSRWTKKDIAVTGAAVGGTKESRIGNADATARDATTKDSDMDFSAYVEFPDESSPPKKSSSNDTSLSNMSIDDIIACITEELEEGQLEPLSFPDMVKSTTVAKEVSSGKSMSPTADRSANSAEMMARSTEEELEDGQFESSSPPALAESTSAVNVASIVKLTSGTADSSANSINTTALSTFRPHSPLAKMPGGPVPTSSHAPSIDFPQSSSLQNPHTLSTVSGAATSVLPELSAASKPVEAMHSEDDVTIVMSVEPKQPASADSLLGESSHDQVHLTQPAVARSAVDGPVPNETARSDSLSIRNMDSPSLAANTFVCGIEGCTRSYKTRAQLQNHLLNKWLRCPDCVETEFKAHRNNTYIRHRKVVHGISSAADESIKNGTALVKPPVPVRPPTQPPVAVFPTTGTIIDEKPLIVAPKYSDPGVTADGPMIIVNHAGDISKEERDRLLTMGILTFTGDELFE